MLEPLFQNTQTFVERHASLLQMRELLGEHKQLTVRNLECFCRNLVALGPDTVKNFRDEIACCARWHWPWSARCACQHGIDANRDAVLLFDLPNCDATIRAVQNALH